MPQSRDVPPAHPGCRHESTSPIEGSRRVFVLRACQLAAGVTLGTAATACGGGSGGGPTSPSPITNATPLPVLNAAVSGAQATLTIGDGSPLASPGGMAVVQTSAGDLLVARTGPEAFTALTAVCTHEACQITGSAGSTFVCPCHGSRYSTRGAVLNGPATRPLREFPTQFANGVLTIQL